MSEFNNMECKTFEVILGIDKVCNVYKLDEFRRGYEVAGYDGDTRDYAILKSEIEKTIVRYLCSDNIEVSISYRLHSIEVRILFLDKKYSFLNRKFKGIDKYDLLIETMYYYINIDCR